MASFSLSGRGFLQRRNKNGKMKAEEEGDEEACEDRKEKKHIGRMRESRREM